MDAKHELSDEERQKRWEEGARTLKEIDPVKWRKLQRQRWLPAIGWGLGAIIGLGYLAHTLSDYESLFRIEETAPPPAREVLEVVTPGPALPVSDAPACTCPPAPEPPESPGKPGG